jgi:fructose/tagatose bisphosphate aldolase
MKLYTNKELLNLDHGKEFYPRKIWGASREAIKQTVQSKMRLLGSSGKTL